MTDSFSPIHTWLVAPLESAVRQALDRVRRAEDVAHLAVMPDVHLAGEVCVGTAMATRRLIYPGAVGGDIGCGMLAMAFDSPADVLSDPVRAGEILRALGERIPGRRQARASGRALPDNLRSDDLSCGKLIALSKTEAALQLGTLGGGNHFVELQADDEDRLWLMIHSGSRGMGQAIRDHHVAQSKIRSQGLLALDSEAAQAYLNDHHWARNYAKLNRKCMAHQVIDILQSHGVRPADDRESIHIDHNHVEDESHFGERFYVHRKGAMPADEGMPGVIPGSMGTLSVHVVGLGEATALRSSAHGAGRQLSRVEARERLTRADLRQQMRGVWFDPRVRNLIEEAPRAYKNLLGVLRAQSDLVQVTRRLRPLLVYKSGGAA